jgi:hypothetical protein
VSINVGKKFWEISRWNKYSNLRKGEADVFMAFMKKQLQTGKKYL